VPADFDPSKDTVRVAGKEVRPELGWVMTTPFNMMSRCPVMSVPSGFAGNGVPTGLQIVAPTYRDEIAMQAAMAFEAAIGGWYGKGQRPSV
jgi:amidase